MKKDDNSNVMHKVFELYLLFLQTNQSEIVQKHAFAALRSFINKVYSTGEEYPGIFLQQLPLFL